MKSIYVVFGLAFLFIAGLVCAARAEAQDSCKTYRIDFVENCSLDSYPVTANGTPIGKVRAINGAAPLQISNIPYILHKHQGISPAVFSRKSINSLANCIACHPAAASARFDDDNVTIPAQ